MLAGYERWLARLNHAIETALGCLGLLITGTVALQVFCRYALNNSLFWAEELARYLLVWISFLGATVAYFRGLHPGVDVFAHRLSGHGRERLRTVVHLVSLFFFAAILWAGLRFAWFTRFQLSAAMGIPMWTVLAVIPLASLILLLHACGFFWRSLWRRGDERG